MVGSRALFIEVRKLLTLCMPVDDCCSLFPVSSDRPSSTSVLHVEHKVHKATNSCLFAGLLIVKTSWRPVIALQGLSATTRSRHDKKEPTRANL